MPDEATLKVLSQVLFDPELTDFHELEGSSSLETLTYFLQYCGMQPQSMELGALSQTMENLRANETELHDLRQRTFHPDELHVYANTIVDRLGQLKLNEYILLPGGWLNSPKGGHAIIYQLTKTENGLLFTIHNSGEGLQHHEKTSSKHKELFYPTNSSLIPTDVSMSHLSEFILELTIPQLPNHPERIEVKTDIATFDADLLYFKIRMALGFLKAELQPVSQTTPDALTTASQLSGTCAQRVIHQFLKQQFASHSEYQRFIFKFKMHAITDYINIITHAGSCSDTQKKLIQSAIANTLRLAKTSELFSDDEKMIINQQATNFNERIKSILTKNMKTDLKSMRKQKVQAVSLSMLNEPLPYEANQVSTVQQVPYYPTLSIRHQPILINGLNTIINNCEERRYTAPLFVLDQIEQTVLDLSLDPDAYNDCDLPTLLNCLNQLQDLYQSTYEINTGSTQLPRQFVTLTSLLAIRQRLLEHNATASDSPTFVHFKSLLTDLLSNKKHLIYLACNQPDFDKRMRDLISIYSENQTDPKTDGLSYYRQLLDAEPPEIKYLLSKLYEEERAMTNSVHNIMHEQYQKADLTQLVMVASYFDDKGILLPKESLVPEQFSEEEYTTLKPLLNKCAEQFVLEYFIYKGLAPFCVEQSSKPGKPLRFDAYAMYAGQKITILEGLRPNDTANLTHKYTFDARFIERILKHTTVPSDQWNANEIQLITSGQVNHLLARNLLCLRTAPSMQAILTLDYFIQHIDVLNDASLRMYLEANLFELDTLKRCIENDPVTIIEAFDAFILKGLQENITLNEKTIFFIRLRFLFNRYLAECKHLDGTMRLQHNAAELDEYLSLSHDPVILASIHQYRFLSDATLHQCDASDYIRIPALLQSHFHLQANGSAITVAIDTSRDIQRTTYQANRWFKQIPQESWIAHLPNIMTDLGIDVSLLSFSGVYPNFIAQDKDRYNVYSIQAQLGRIYLNGFARIRVPLELASNRALLKAFQLENETHCFVSADEQCYTFKTTRKPQQHIRFIKRHDGFLIQKKWPEDDESSAWYELKSVLPQQQKQWNLSTSTGKFLSNELPSVFISGNNTFWFNRQNDVFFIVQNNQPIYQTKLVPDLSYPVIEKINRTETEPRSYLDPPPPLIEESIERFEDPTFIVTRRHLTTEEQYTIECPRYGLSFDVLNGNIRLSGTPYIVDQGKSPLGSNIANLHLSDGTNRHVILAVQRFSVVESLLTMGESYPLQHDNSNAIVQRELDSKIDAAWHYEHTERAITYQVIDGEMIPETPADALYLCYVYLASHQPEKAWALLNKIDDLEGNADELRFLSWIINSLPHKHKPPKDYEKDVKFETHRYVAYKLKALKQLTDAYATGKTIKRPEKIVNPQTANDYAYNQNIEELDQFKKNLPSHTAALFKKLQKVRRNITYGFVITHQECLSLLNFCEPSETESNALGYEKRRLYMKALITEKSQLTRLQNAYQRNQDGALFPPHYSQRLIEIEQELKSLPPIRKKHTIRTTKFVNLTMNRNDQFIDRFLLNNDARTAVTLWENNLHHIPAIDRQSLLLTLKFNIKDSDFIIYFPGFLSIAIDGTAEEKDKLAQFCKLYLQGWASKPPLSSDHSNIPKLTKLLYHVLSDKKQSFQSIKTAKIKTIGDRSYSDFSLGKVADIAAKIPVTEGISFEQIEEVDDHVLATNSDILADLDDIENATTLVRLNNRPISTSIMNPLIQQLPGSVHDFMEQYKAVEHEYQNNFMHLLDNLKSGTEALQSAELAAGRLKHDCVQKQRTLAAQFLNLLTQNSLREQTEAALVKSTSSTNTAWEDVLTLANQALNNRLSKESSALTMEILSLERSAHLKKDELLTLYVNGLESDYLSQTGLSKEQVECLHNGIHAALALDIEQQQLKRLLNALETPTNLALIAEVLASENHPNAQNDPELAFFQYHENKLLRPRQIEALNNLLKPKSDFTTTESADTFNETVEKIIMGGGKSKILLPLLAKKKARGTNLVIFEVPRALQPTNRSDLNAISRALFNQRAHGFEFNRNSDCSPTRLKKIYDHFSSIIVNREYLVTTGESMQSLELKYIDLLLSNPSTKEQKESLYWLSKITSLIHDRGDAVIDEIHQGFDIPQELNYTRGEISAVDPTLVDNSIQLYQFMHKLTQSTIQTNDAESFRSVTVSLLNALPKALIEHVDSPLKHVIHELVSHYGPDIKKEIQQFLTNESDSNVINALPHPSRELFAFYKAQCSSLLPFTLSQKNNETYGSCYKKNDAGQYVIDCTNVFERALAIPHKKSQPRAGSRFGNVLSTMNFTIQSLWVNGLDRELIPAVLEDMLAIIQQERKQQILEGSTTPGPMTALLNKLLEGTTITRETLDLTNSTQIDDIFKAASHDTSLLFIAAKKILGHITTNASLLQSNALNHASLYHSVQGVSGTPFNHATYHQRLQFNAKTSLGSDGYIIANLQQQNTPIQPITLSTSNPNGLHQYLSAIYNDNARAIIDVGAILADKPNLDVAITLSGIIQEKNPKIKYVLYYDNNTLCALDIKSHVSTVLTQSELSVIKQKIHATPDEWFTYYDQAHTLGSDITQATNGVGIVLIDEKTRLESFLQGAMRMRDLDNSQRIHVVVPEHIHERSLDQLFEYMQTNEHQQIAEENIIASLAKMKDVIRRDLLNKINRLDHRDVEKKSALMQKFKSYFIQEQQHGLFQKYGNKSQSVDTINLLDEYKTELLEDWARLCSTAGINTHHEHRGLKDELQCIITTSLPFCSAKAQRQQDPGNRSREVETQNETMMYAQVQLQTQNEIVQTSALQGKVPLKPYQWNEDALRRFPNHSSQHDLSYQNTDRVVSLNTLIKHARIFNEQLTTSYNYEQTYEQQNDLLNNALKPVQVILFKWDGAALSACLVTTEEAETIAKLIQPDMRHIWLGTTQHHILAGNPTANPSTLPMYNCLMEQIQFFNGEITSLNTQKTTFEWLSKRPQEKIAFFRNKLAPYRSTKSHDIDSLEFGLYNLENHIKELKNHAFEDMRTLDWAKKIPLALPSSVTLLEQCAHAFELINTTSPETWESNLTPFYQRLPPYATEAITEHQINMRNALHHIAQITIRNNEIIFPSPLSEGDQHVLKQLIPTHQTIIDTTSGEQQFAVMENLLTWLEQPAIHQAIPHVLSLMHTYTSEHWMAFIMNAKLPLNVVTTLLQHPILDDNALKSLMDNNQNPMIYLMILSDSRQSQHHPNAIIQLDKLLSQHGIPNIDNERWNYNLLRFDFLSIYPIETKSKLLKLLVKQTLSPEQFLSLINLGGEALNDELLQYYLNQRSKQNALQPAILSCLIKVAKGGALCSKLAALTAELNDAKALLEKEPPVESVVLQTIVQNNKLNPLALYQQLLTHPNCSAGILNMILQRTNNETIMARIEHHPHVDGSVRLNLLEKPMLPKSMHSIITGITSDDITQAPRLLAYVLNYNNQETDKKIINSELFLSNRLDLLNHIPDDKIVYVISSLDTPLTGEEITQLLKQQQHNAPLFDYLLDTIPKESPQYIELISLIIEKTQFAGEAGNVLFQKMITQSNEHILKKSLDALFITVLNKLAIKNPSSIIQSAASYLGGMDSKLMSIFLNDLPPIVHSMEELWSVLCDLPNLNKKWCVPAMRNLLHCLIDQNNDKNRALLIFMQRFGDSFEDDERYELVSEGSQEFYRAALTVLPEFISSYTFFITFSYQNLANIKHSFRISKGLGNDLIVLYEAVKHKIVDTVLSLKNLDRFLKAVQDELICSDFYNLIKEKLPQLYLNDPSFDEEAEYYHLSKEQQDALHALPELMKSLKALVVDETAVVSFASALMSDTPIRIKAAFDELTQVHELKREQLPTYWQEKMITTFSEVTQPTQTKPSVKERLNNMIDETAPKSDDTESNSL